MQEIGPHQAGTCDAPRRTELYVDTSAGVTAVGEERMSGLGIGTTPPVTLERSGVQRGHASRRQDTKRAPLARPPGSTAMRPSQPRERDGLESNDAAAMPSRILVADDEPVIRDLLIDILEDAGHEVDAVEDGQAVIEALASRDVDLVLLDLNMPRVSGLNVLAALPSIQTDARVIVLTAFGTVQSAVEAMKHGAYDFVSKPVEEPELLGVVDRALDSLRAHRELARVRSSKREMGLSGIVGKTAAMVRVFRLIERVAPTRASVLVMGETGTGKELVACAVHELSPRAHKPYVAVNCSAIPETLIETELFGHTKGSFTGAVQSRKGLVEEAAGGTLFLDEISSLSEDVQAKLLRVLQDRRVQRVGSNTAVPVDFRLVAATNRDLGELVAQGRFREDLFFRLNVFPIVVPPLRERREDIPLLAQHFLTRYAVEHGLEPPRLAPETLARMLSYEWPGNVRELENYVERSVIMYPGRDGFPFDPPGGSERGSADVLRQAIEDDWKLDRLEREYILSILARNRWRQDLTAEALGISRRTIHRKLARYRAEGYLPRNQDA
jgi:DNA-binding NtrC family response regulator